MSQWLLFCLLGLVWCPLPIVHTFTFMKFSCQSKQLKQSTTNTKQCTSVKLLYILTIVEFILKMYFICYSITISWILHPFRSNATGTIASTFPFYLTGIVGMTIASALVAVIYIIRAKISFENTVYQLTLCELIIPTLFTILQVILFSIGLFVDICNCLIDTNDDFDVENRLIFYGVGLIALSIAYICICIIFAKKLLRIIIDQRQSIYNNNNNTNNNSDNIAIQLDEKQSLLTDVATKQTVLSSVATFVSIVVAVTMIILGDNHITYWFATLGPVIVSITLWFSFAFAESQYQYYCKICHRNCKKKSQQIIINRIGTKNNILCE